MKLRINVANTMQVRGYLNSLVEFLDTQSYNDVGLVIQVLPNSLRTDIELNDVDEETLKRLDTLTSRVITIGGSISADKIETLEKISEFLPERLNGPQNYELQ